MGMPPTYPRAVIALDWTTVGHATRSTAGDLPRLQDTDARQVTSAAQAEHGLDEVVYECQQCGTETKRAIKQQVKRATDHREGVRRPS
jgi:hypothetical protein